MPLFTQSELHQAADLVYQYMQPTPQYCWPLIGQRLSAEVWIKHENHTPTGAFKVRGGVTFIDWLKRTHPEVRGIVSATRGNHGQSQARAAKAAGLDVMIVVPRGNSPEKNKAMEAFGATLVEAGEDFDEAKIEVARIADEKGFYPVPSFHQELVRGVATCGLELLSAQPDIERVYVPIGMGSGICGMISARDALGLKTEVIGVVSERADCAMRSALEGKLVENDSARTFADGMAVRVPSAEALAIYQAGAADFVAVSDEAIAQAIRVYYHDTHNVAEGAGAAALAAMFQQADQIGGKKVAAVLSGGNIDADKMMAILGGGTPEP